MTRYTRCSPVCVKQRISPRAEVLGANAAKMPDGFELTKYTIHNGRHSTTSNGLYTLPLATLHIYSCEVWLAQFY